jgi:hypothetical protein
MFRASPYLLFLTLFLTACKTPPPNWVENPHSTYPDSRYLVAVGEGDTRRTAENVADAQLARIFESRIESADELVDQSKESTKTFSRTSELSSQIRISANQTLFNIQHAESWVDAHGRVHAVAYLDRRKTAAIYQEKIDQENQQILFLIKQAEKSKNPLQKYALLRGANQHAKQQALLLRQLQTIHAPTFSSISLQYTLPELQKALAASARAVRVHIQTNGELSEQIVPLLEHLATHFGFVVTAPPASLKMIGHLAFQDLEKSPSDLFFVRYQFQLQLKDDQNQTLFVLEKKGREAHISSQEARFRALRTLSRALSADGIARLEAYFDDMLPQKKPATH